MDSSVSCPIRQLAESPWKTQLICIPAYSYSRLVNPGLFSVCSPFYAASLQCHDSSFTNNGCAHCGTEHVAPRFCLPYNYLPAAVDFLIDFLERNLPAVLSLPLFLSILPLCDYLILDNHVIFDMIQIYISNHLRSPFTEALVDVLSKPAYSGLGAHFAHVYFDDNR